MIWKGLSTSLCQILLKLVEQLQRYGDLKVLKMAAVLHLGFCKFKFLMVGVIRVPFCMTMPHFVKVGQTVAEMS